jgi:sialic acid synthase SpsE
LHSLNPSAIKIASPELNYTALLKEVASYNLPVFLSSGVSKLSDIEEALAMLSVPICLLHCVTAYPAPPEDYNLRVLQSLSSIFGVPVGVSDHSLDPCLVPSLATAMGAVAIEKHFCLSRSDPGLDDPIALPPSDFAEMVKAVREVSEIGRDNYFRERHTHWDRTEESLINNREQTWEVVESILGSGIKKLAPSEEANYQRTNRSIHALRDIKAGEIIEKDSIASLRTEKILRPGLSPSFESKIIGRKARFFIPAGEGIRFEDI